MQIIPPIGCISYATYHAAQTKAKSRLPEDIRWLIYQHPENLEYYPIVVMDARTAQKYGVIMPYFTIGSA